MNESHGNETGGWPIPQPHERWEGNDEAQNTPLSTSAQDMPTSPHTAPIEHADTHSSTPIASQEHIRATEGQTTHTVEGRSQDTDLMREHFQAPTQPLPPHEPEAQRVAAQPAQENPRPYMAPQMSPQEIRPTYSQSQSFPFAAPQEPRVTSHNQNPGTSALPYAPAPLPVTRSKRKKRKAPGWIALLCAMGVTAALSVSATIAITGLRGASAPAYTTQTVAPVSSDGTIADWKAVAAAVSPAVVTINVSSQNASGVGSGVIYDPRGTIVTNYHVISSALNGKGKISVTLADNRIFDATVVGHDQTTDLAVIRLTNPPSDLTVAQFGSSSQLTIGTQVMAIGSPLGLSNTVTTGIISAVNRPVAVSTSSENDQDQQVNPFDPFGQLPREDEGNRSASNEPVITNAIQVDASINPGNSGGPLFDETGSVIGINSSIASNSGSASSAGSIGLGFAIPSDLVVSVVKQLVETGSVDHAVLGVTIKTAAVGVDSFTRAGAQIEEVVPGGAAEKAGLKSGDTITAVDGADVASGKALSGYVRRYKGGDTVKLTVVREGKSSEISVTLQSKK
ncbi:S1C family serine protease [Schaalia sp. lx-260]|uniref:S1C family serine protease n=1 Tax=Schaalia sp. lx-260 TaxID=2899082 RepID=UPI001E41C9EF|nr:trypsin-like peptidase domain-containing protein [Schaalia sp. lx-260]MCD4549109.1 trypsin-like peptidase domain-containing protein [Schaalia sp. lx-260]